MPELKRHSATVVLVARTHTRSSTLLTRSAKCADGGPATVTVTLTPSYMVVLVSVTKLPVDSVGVLLPTPP